jgi:hypothetical protein
VLTGESKMSQGITFEVSASLNNSDYHQILKERRKIESVSQNLEKDQLWGWCVPKVKAIFDIYVEVAEQNYG